MRKIRLNKWNVAVFVLVIAVIVAIPIALIFADTITQPGGGGGGYRLLAHPDLSSLKSDSSVVVYGDVSGIVGPYGDANIALVHTVFTFNVMTYVKGSGASTIYVVALGGTLNGVTETEESPPLPVVGEKYVLFLAQPWGNCPPSPPNAPCILPQTPLNMTYGVVGDPEGRFLVVGGLVFGYKTLFPVENRWIKIDVNGVPLDQFLSQVSSA